MKNRRITKKVLKEIKKEISFWLGIELTDDQIFDIFDDEKVRDDWNIYGSTIDTEFVDTFIDALSMKIMKEKWMNNIKIHSIEEQEWSVKFYKKAEKLGYKVEDCIKEDLEL